MLLFFNYREVLTSKLSIPMAQMVKRLSAMQDTWVRSLGQEDPPEKEMATHSRIPAWEIPQTEEPGVRVRGVAVSDLT